MGRSYIGEVDRRGEQADENSMCKGPVAGRSLGTKNAMGEGRQVKELLERLVETCQALLSGLFFILSPKSNG